MLTISNGWISNTISPARISSVATEALQNARTGRADNSREMSRVERFVDYVFCGSVKKQYMDYLYQMAQNRAWLEQESEKPEPRRVSTKLMQCRNNISRNQDSIKKLMSGNTLEFGFDVSGRPVQWDNFLIFRDKSRSKTIGIPAYSAQLQAPPTQPNREIDPVPPTLNVTRLEDIGIEDLVTIQRSEQLRCQGRTYIVKFTDNNEPIVVHSVESPHAEFELIQRKLTALWAFDNEKYRLSRIPAFESTEVVRKEDLNNIRASGTILCRGVEYQVRAHTLNEPIVFYSSGDLFGKAVQGTLTALWVVEQANCSRDKLERLEKFDGSLTLPSILQEPVTGQSRTSADMDVLNEWTPVSRDAVNNIKALAEIFDEKMELEKGALKETLEALSSDSGCCYKQRETVQQIRSEMHKLANRQETMRQSIQDLRQLYCSLYLLAKNSETSEMRSGFKTRIEQLNECLKDYLTVSTVKWARVAFVVKSGKVNQPPENLEARRALVSYSGTSDTTWQPIAELMKTLDSHQNELLAAFGLRQELIVKVTAIFQSFKGENGAGLDPETGKSFYSPETFSRIISLKKIRNELMNSTRSMTLQALRDKDRVMTEHITSIRKETTDINKNEKRPWPFKRTTSMHWPEKMAKTGEYMSHLQWRNSQVNKAMVLEADKYFARNHARTTLR